MRAHHLLDEYLNEYLAAAGIESDRKGYLFRTCRGRSDPLTENPLTQPDA